MTNVIGRDRTAFRLNNGVNMPAVGLGVYQASEEEAAEAVATAIAYGYRLIDTAKAYGNETKVGEGIRKSGVDRAQLFVTTKLWLTDYGYDATLRGFDESIAELGLDYLDLYLLHWPTKNFDATIQSYKAAEKLLADGRVRAIGVSNFTEQYLDDLVARTDVIPAVNQIELHPYFAQKGLREKNAALGIVTEAWSPIGGVKRYWPGGSSEAAEIRSWIRSSPASARRMERRRRRSSCGGTSRAASSPSRSRYTPRASPRISASSTSR
jgi:diketogulonate reductase-like aldo/keto reductase